MIFKILYIEDDPLDAAQLREAVNTSAGLVKSARAIAIETLRSPAGLDKKLDDSFDLILADVHFRDSKGKEVDRLDDIIEAVEEWSRANGVTKPVPIIAYTGRGRDALQSCLKKRAKLYDIWDKSVADAPYVTWRLTQLALELSRTRPDALLQRCIRKMSTGASWHVHVVEMTRQYSNGWTEADQIVRAGTAIDAILEKMNGYDACKNCWKLMQQWEGLSRAVSQSTRGHARHVVNVYWLGYYLLHHPVLREIFAEMWKAVAVDRRNTSAIASVAPLEVLNDAWVYCGLFHDIAGCIEKLGDVKEKADKLVKVYEPLVLCDSKREELTDRSASAVPAKPKWVTYGKELNERALQLFFELPQTVQLALRPGWDTSLAECKPDHGVVAGAYMLGLALPDKQLAFAREAARGMVVHNLMGKLLTPPSELMHWTDEPLGCLLVLCDQLQTWDRERTDETILDADWPNRAELTELEVSRGARCPQVRMAVDYLAPRHLDYDPVLFERVKVELTNVLRENPIPALKRLGSWPFSVHVDFSLNGQPLNTRIDFACDSSTS